MPGVPVILFVVFLVLKLVDKIDWSWWWVTSPLWITAIAGIIIMAIWIPIVRSFMR